MRASNDIRQRILACSIFDRLFENASKDPGPQLPTYFVTRESFHRECRRNGLDIPADWIGATEWEESVGITDHAHKVFSEYHKAHGSDFTPMEKGAWRLRQRKRKSTQIHPHP